MSVAERASEALDRIGGAVGGTTGVAEELAARAREMKDASSKVAENVSSTSAGVEENAAAANQMQATTHEITAVHDAGRARRRRAVGRGTTGGLRDRRAGLGRRRDRRDGEGAARASRGGLDGLVARFISVADEDAPDAGAHALRVPNFGPAAALQG